MRGAGILVLAGLLLHAESVAATTAGEKKAQLCLLCHKVANASAPGSAMPLLEGQPAQYLYLQTKAYKEKRRAEPAMQTNVANLSDRDLRDIAAWLAAQRPAPAAYQLDPAKVAVGKTKAEQLGCATCHLPTFYGAGDVPRLAGQTPGYIKARLEDFGAGKRRHGTGPRSAPATPLNDQEMEGLAQFLASLE
jgi:cytochrome c553